MTLYRCTYKWTCGRHQGHVIAIKDMWSPSRTCGRHQGHVVTIKDMWSPSRTCGRHQRHVVAIKDMWSPSRTCGRHQGHMVAIKDMWSPSKTYNSVSSNTNTTHKQTSIQTRRINISSCRITCFLIFVKQLNFNLFFINKVVHECSKTLPRTVQAKINHI